MQSWAEGGPADGAGGGQGSFSRGVKWEGAGAICVAGCGNVASCSHFLLWLHWRGEIIKWLKNKNNSQSVCVMWAAAAEDAAAAGLQSGKSVLASTGTQENIDRILISIKESRESLSAPWEVPQQPNQTNNGNLYVVKCGWILGGEWRNIIKFVFLCAMHHAWCQM